MTTPAKTPTFTLSAGNSFAICAVIILICVSENEPGVGGYYVAFD